MDFYGYPEKAPGAHQTDGSSLSRRDARLRFMRDVFHNNAQFTPHPMLHEFEALVLAALDSGAGSSPTLRREASRNSPKLFARQAGRRTSTTTPQPVPRNAS